MSNIINAFNLNNIPVTLTSLPSKTSQRQLFKPNLSASFKNKPSQSQYPQQSKSHQSPSNSRSSSFSDFNESLLSKVASKLASKSNPSSAYNNILQTNSILANELNDDKIPLPPLNNACNTLNTSTLADKLPNLTSSSSIKTSFDTMSDSDESQDKQSAGVQQSDSDSAAFDFSQSNSL